MNSYAKFGVAARRHFSAICEKPMGAHMCPPGRARVKKCLKKLSKNDNIIFICKEISNDNQSPFLSIEHILSINQKRNVSSDLQIPIMHFGTVQVKLIE